MPSRPIAAIWGYLQVRAGAEWEKRQGCQGQGQPCVLVLARLCHTLTNLDVFAREGWVWFLHNAPDTSLL